MCASDRDRQQIDIYLGWLCAIDRYFAAAAVASGVPLMGRGRQTGEFDAAMGSDHMCTVNSSICTVLQLAQPRDLCGAHIACL